jgi:mannosyltransferase OCH1-like enzyme
MYSQNKKYKFGCVICCYNRKNIVENSIRSINESFLPPNLIFVLIDDCSKEKIDYNLKHDHIFIQNPSNVGISSNLAVGWDILKLLKVEYFANLDSDVLVSKNWLSSLFNSHKNYEYLSGNNNHIVTGFNGSRHKILKENETFKIKKSIGGINLFFHEEIFSPIVRRSLTNIEPPSSIQESINNYDKHGDNPKFHEYLEGWDWNLMEICKQEKVSLVCTKKSSVQHTGFSGITSRIRSFETCKDFEDVCTPKIIHQFWMNFDLPDHLKRMQESVIYNHKDYEYKFWTDAAINNFVKSKYPDLYNYFESGFEFTIQKMDFARLLVLYHFGGVYIDLDSLCVRNVNDIIGYPCCLIKTKKHEAFSSKHYPIILNNAFISSEKNNHFIKTVLTNILNYVHPKNYKEYCSFNNSYSRILKATGPLMITESYLKYENKRLIKLLDNKYYYGVEYSKKNSPRQIISHGLCVAEKHDCHFVHMHESSWWKNEGVTVPPKRNPNFNHNIAEEEKRKLLMLQSKRQEIFGKSAIL